MSSPKNTFFPLAHYKDHTLACDFFTIDTLFLQTVYVFFFIELHTRRAYLAGCTTHPINAQVAAMQANFSGRNIPKVHPA